LRQAIGDEILARSRLRHPVGRPRQSAAVSPARRFSGPAKVHTFLTKTRQAKKGRSQSHLCRTQRQQQQARWADDGCLSRSRNGIPRSQSSRPKWIACAWLSPFYPSGRLSVFLASSMARGGAQAGWRLVVSSVECAVVIGGGRAVEGGLEGICRG
jgi:hypothetical protein